MSVKVSPSPTFDYILFIQFFLTTQENDPVIV